MFKSMTDLHFLQKLHLLNTLRPRQNGCRFADDIFECIFLNENVWISLNISLKYILKVPFNNIPTLVQIWLGADQATNHYLNQWWLIYCRIYASLGLNELRDWSRSGGSYGLRQQHPRDLLSGAGTSRELCCPAPGRPKSVVQSNLTLLLLFRSQRSTD